MSQLIQSLVNRMCVDMALSVGVSLSMSRSWTWCYRCCSLITQEQKLGEAGAILQLVLVAWLHRNGCWVKLVLAAVSSSCGICREGVGRRPKVISENFLKLAFR